MIVSPHQETGQYHYIEVAIKLSERILCLCQGSNSDRPVVQSVARLYTD
jgi:hypothetical protein